MAEHLAAALPPPLTPNFDGYLEGDDDDAALGATRTAGKTKRAEKRADKAKTREAHEQNHTKELRGLLEVLRALPQAVPSLAAGLQAAQGPQDGIDVVVPSKRPAARLPPPDEASVEAQLSIVEAALRAGMGAPYRELPESFGPGEGVPVLGNMIDRPPKYQEKYLAQELSLLAKVWALAGGDDASGAGLAGAAPPTEGALAVVDIGAGNGCLALLTALVLGGYAVLIDHTLPPEELRVEAKVPEPYRSRVLRVTGDVKDVDVARDLAPLLRRHSVTRAVVVAKHLCGVGTDLALELVRNWRGGPSASAGEDGHEAAPDHGIACLGAVFATCCGHKIGASDRATFASLHAEDAYLCSLTAGDEERLRAFLASCTRCVAWRTTAGALQNRITGLQVRAAELFEDALQQPRLNALQRFFPAAVEVVFVSAKSSPQNRCLLAGEVEAVRRAAEGEGAEALLRDLCITRDALLAACGGPLDLKPKGFVSSKYDYDGT